MDSSSTSNTSVEFGGIVRIVKETTKLYKHYYNNTIGVSQTEKFSHGAPVLTHETVMPSAEWKTNYS